MAETTNSIGAARVFLDVDATGWDRTLAQAKNAAIGFGKEAEAAFDRSSDGARRANTRLLDYVASMGRADSQMDRLVRSAARAGAERPVIDAAIRTWENYQQQIAETNRALEEAASINRAFDAARMDASQRGINETLGVRDSGAEAAAAQARRRQDAEAALSRILDEQEAQYRQIAQQIAMAADEAREIDQAFNQQRAANAQQSFNQGFGVEAPQRDVSYREEQARVVRALTLQLELQEQAEAKLQAQQRAGQDYMQYLTNLRDTAGKTHYEILRLKAAQLGLGKEGSMLVDQIEAQDRAMTKGTITTKQYEWAMRGLPAQFTDIFTSLAAGQNPMLVLLQQGGQIKDMFGGVLPAIQAVGGAALKMINPLTVGVAILGTFAIAAYRGSEELGGLNRSLAMTSNYAGVTASSAYNLARGLDAIKGVTTGGAIAALSEVARSGRFTADQLDMITTAAVKMQASTGQAIADTVAEFKELQGDPVAAIAKLNEQYGFLTAEQYRNIAALQDQGREFDAQTLAMSTYAQEVERRTGEVNENLGLLQSAWKGVKEIAKEAWDAMLDIGREGSSNEQIAAMSQTIKGLERSLAPDASFFERMQYGGLSAEDKRKRIADLREQITAEIREQAAANREANQQQANQRAQDAAIELQQEVREFRTKEEKKTAELARAAELRQQALARFAGRDASSLEGKELEAYNAILSDHDRIVKGINEKYKERAKSGRDTTQMIRDQAAAELASIQTQTRQVQSQYELREISVEQYFEKLRELAQQERDVQLRSNEAQIAALAGTKDAERQISQLRANSARVQEQFAQANIDLTTRQQQALRQLENAYRSFQYSLEDGTRNLQREMDDMVSAVGMGDRQAEVAGRITQLYRDQSDQITQLRRDVEQRTITEVEAEKRIQAIRQETIEQYNIIIEGYQRREEAERSWINGVMRAFDNLQAQANNFSDVAENTVVDSVNGISDAVLDFGFTGELTFDKVGESVARLIGRFLLLRAIMSGLNAAFPQFSQFGMANGIGAPVQVGGQRFAKGGTPPGLDAYVNQIVSKPTYFAKGGVPNNVMGEAGTEGIFPLKRDSQGRLGVISTGDSSGKVTVNIHGAPSTPQVNQRQTSDGTELDIIFSQFESKIGQRISQGSGPVYSATKGRFQVKDRS